ncbi:MAG TPA: hypothetical protein VIH85_17105 [Solirubrobacteraceae bacterium]
MSDGSAAAGTARRVGSGTIRLVRAWRALPHESRLAAFASFGLFLTLFLPWYQRHFFVVVAGHAQPAADTQTGWGAFSFVEAAVLLIAAGVLVLLFERAEGRAFHLPGGDGGVITAAGLWTCVLVIWRIFDKQGATSHAEFVTSYGIEWGIFFALAAAAFLAYSGSRIRAAHRPEPPLPGEDHAPAGSNNAAADTTTLPRRPRERPSEPRREGPSEPRRERPSEPRRRARTPRPASADRPASRARRPRATTTPDGTATPNHGATATPNHGATAAPKHGATAAPDHGATEPPPHRPRHRVSADELFERVVPEDPPTMRFGRIPPSSRSPLSPAPEADPPTPVDDQLTMPFREDETIRLDDERTVRLGDEGTVRLGDEGTMPLGEDGTVPLGDEGTMSMGDEGTTRLGEDETLPMRRRPEH